jgi:phosphomannomutase
VPTPALAAFAMARGAPAIMVTGSHIPGDRNGLKFYRADGEIDKADEAAIVAAHGALSRDAAPAPSTPKTAAPDPAALDAFKARYTGFLPPGALSGLRVGVYQQSSVARDLMMEVLTDLSAEAVALGRSETFVPVDTEALRPEDTDLLARWSGEGGFDAIVSTDGDADRPLIADETGRFVRGDLVGAITAAWAGADVIVVPVTANSALEACGRFGRVARTRVGSPHVLAGMAEEARRGAERIVGFEANGGVMLGSDLGRDGRRLGALPTRDSLLPILACLCEVAARGRPLSAIADEFGFRAAQSDRLQNVPQDRSAAFLTRLPTEPAPAILAELGTVEAVDTTDGVRLHLEGGTVVHYRASGNAPELRCYVEAATAADAQALLDRGMALAARQTGASPATR